jgi:hypothetical protein
MYAQALKGNAEVEINYRTTIVKLLDIQSCEAVLVIKEGCVG